MVFKKSVLAKIKVFLIYLKFFTGYLYDICKTQTFPASNSKVAVKIAVKFIIQYAHVYARNRLEFVCINYISNKLKKTLIVLKVTPLLDKQLKS